MYPIIALFQKINIKNMFPAFLLEEGNAVNTIRITGLDVDIGGDGTDDDVTAKQVTEKKE